MPTMGSISFLFEYQGLQAFLNTQVFKIARGRVRANGEVSTN